MGAPPVTQLLVTATPLGTHAGPVRRARRTPDRRIDAAPPGSGGPVGRLDLPGGRRVVRVLARSRRRRSWHRRTLRRRVMSWVESEGGKPALIQDSQRRFSPPTGSTATHRCERAGRRRGTTTESAELILRRVAVPGIEEAGRGVARGASLTSRAVPRGRRQPCLDVRAMGNARRTRKKFLEHKWRSPCVVAE